MKNITRLTLLFLIFNSSFFIGFSQVSINENGNTPDPSAMLDVSSTDKGLLIPRLDSTARKNIVSPAEGLMVYDTSTVTFWYYDNDQWNEIRNGTERLTATDLLQNIPSEPNFDCLSLISSTNLSRSPADIAYKDDYVYVINRGTDDLKVIDVSDPTAPVEVGSIGVSSFPRAILLSGNFAYIVDSSDEDMRVIDISNPYEPTLSDSIGIGIDPLDIAIIGDYAYVIDDGANSMFVIDISDPTNSEIITELGIGNTPTAIANSGNYIFVTDEASNDLKVIDASDPQSPMLIDTLGIGGTPENIAISGNYAYVIDQGSRDLKVIDISTPTAISLVGSLGIGRTPNDILVEDNYAYIVDQWTEDLKVIDVSDPTAPFLVNSTPLEELPLGLAKAGNYAYTVDFLEDKLYIVNLSCATPIGVNPFGQYFETVEMDNLGDHTATQNIALNNNYISNDGDDEGIAINDDGKVSIDSLSIADAYTMPAEDGAANQVLTTDGNGSLSWTDQTVNMDTDDQMIDTLRLYGTTLAISLEDDGEIEQTVDLASLQDNLGDHTATQNIALDGNWISYDGNGDGITVDNNGRILIGNTFNTQGYFISGDGDNEGLAINSDARVRTTHNLEVGTTLTMTGGNILLNDNWLSNDGGNEGISIDDTGYVTLSSGFQTSNPLIFNHTVDTVLTGAPSADGFRFRIVESYFNQNEEAYIFEKTDGNQTDPDGGIVFTNTGRDGVMEDALVIRGSGRVGIGRDPQTNIFEVEGEASKTSPGEWAGNSDTRLKKNITALNPQSTLQKLLALNGITYEWDDDKTGIDRPKGIQYGFTAQNIQKVFPSLVTEDNLGYLQAAYGTYDAMYVEALRALSIENEELKMENAELTSRVEKLEVSVAKINQLEAMLTQLQAQMSDNSNSVITDSSDEK